MEDIVTLINVTREQYKEAGFTKFHETGRDTLQTRLLRGHYCDSRKSAPGYYGVQKVTS